VNTKFLKNNADLIKYLLKQLCKTSRKLSKHAEKVKIIAGHFELDPKDVKDWIKHTRWTMKWDLKKKRINKPLKILKRLNLIDDKLKYRDVVFKL